MEEKMRNGISFIQQIVELKKEEAYARKRICFD